MAAHARVVLDAKAFGEGLALAVGKLQLVMASGFSTFGCHLTG